MARIDKRKAKALLKKAAKGREDHIAEYPKYTFPGTVEPCCIVGQVFSYIDPEILKRIAQLDVQYAGPWKLAGEDIFGEVGFTDGALDVLDKAQTVQDGRDEEIHDRSWGSAVNAALAL